MITTLTNREVIRLRPQFGLGADLVRSHPARNLTVVEGFAARPEVLAYDELAASHTGQLRAELARSGMPIGA